MKPMVVSGVTICGVFVLKSHSINKIEPSGITYLRLSITNECDLRCNYCMPHRNASRHAGLPLTLHEIATLVDGFARNGVTKVRLTGGEPLVRRDVVEIVKSIAQTPGIETVGLTTNGTRLEELAADLADAGLKAVNISLDTLNPETFLSITGRDQLDLVLRGIDAALRQGFEKVKINTVVMRGVNDTELPEIASLANRLPVEVRFIELMPLGHSTEVWQSMYIGAAEIREILGGLIPRVGQGSSSASLYEFGAGTVGIISPMSRPFCDACNRIRVTSSGVIKPCLRLPDEENIRHLLSEPDFVIRLGEIIARLSSHKLSCETAMTSAIQAKAMSLVGG